MKPSAGGNRWAATDVSTGGLQAPPANLHDCLRDRESRREFGDGALSAAELSFLLWATQGVKRVIGNGIVTLRPVPSAGARHPFETYLVINRVDGVRPGLYRYLPISHQLQELPTPAAIGDQMRTVSAGEEWPAAAAAVFLWSCVAERGEWAYGATAHKMMLLDAGHIAQNLYLACEAIGCGTCAYAGYSHNANQDGGPLCSIARLTSLACACRHSASARCGYPSPHPTPTLTETSSSSRQSMRQRPYR
ncbi:MAG: SagB/ThcOx family dehydrogenase [Chloroflexota bacterium]